MKEPEGKKEADAFTRFRDLTGKLIAVPKAEVERQKAKDERRKEKRPIPK